MKKIIWKKKTDNSNSEVRRCLNCGKDISDKRKHAKFCCSTCYQAYYGMTKPF